MLGTPYELTRSDMGNTKAVWLYDLENDEERCWENVVSPKFLKYRLEWIMEKSIDELQDLFYNNFVDILITPQWSLKFPFSTFIENFSGYRRINHVIITDEESESIEDIDDSGLSQEISLLTMIENYVEGLPYTAHIKEKLREVSNRLYHEALREMEEKKSYENN